MSREDAHAKDRRCGPVRETRDRQEVPRGLFIVAGRATVLDARGIRAVRFGCSKENFGRVLANLGQRLRVIEDDGARRVCFEGTWDGEDFAAMAAGNVTRRV